MAHVHHYVSCGLTIASEIAIPGLAPVAPAAHSDLQVSVSGEASSAGERSGERVRYISAEREADGSAQLTVSTGSTGTHRFRYHDRTEFLIDREGTCVRVHWEAPLTEADAAVYLLGPVLGFIMRLRGFVSLHASAVMIDGAAVAFVGDAWTGKSTIAAAFASLGYPVLSDDLLPIAMSEEACLAYPSHPRITLWPDSARAVFGTANDLPSLTPTYDKRFVDLKNGDRFHSSPLPLEVIYFLGSRTTGSTGTCIETMRPQDALLSLVSNTYGNYLLDAAMRAVEFDLLSLVVAHVTVRRINLSSDIEQLRDACRQLAQQLAPQQEKHL